MTVSTLTNSVEYVGNGSATSFTVPFKVLDEDHLVVQRRVAATGVVEYTYVGTEYSYSGIGDDSGTLTLAGTALSSTYELVIERVVPYTQPLDIVNAGGFYPETVEEQLDLTTMQIQQVANLAEDIETRALMVPVGETAPSYDEFAAAFQGDPGGNILAVGLFGAIATMTVPAGTTTIRTSGYTTDGKGAAFYNYSVLVDAAYVIANPLTSKIDAAGRGFRLATEQTITPYMFGAIGNSTLNFDTSSFSSLTDDSAALTAFFAFVTANRCSAVNYGGIYGVSQGFVIGDRTLANETVYLNSDVFQGSLVLAVRSAITGAVITVRNPRGCEYGPIHILGPETVTGWATRLYDIGVHIENAAQMQVFKFIFARHAKFAGCYNSGRAGDSDNVFQNVVLNSFFHGCGSGIGSLTITDNNFQNATYSARVDAGSTGDAAQTTTFTVSAVPSLLVDTYGVPTYAQIGTDLHKVISIDRALSKVVLYPWADLTAAASGTIRYIFGGGVINIGGDAGMFDIKAASSFCAFGMQNLASYGGRFQVTSQGNAINFGHGSSTANVSYGAEANLYGEAGLFDLVYDATGHLTVNAEQAMAIDKVMMFNPRLTVGNVLKEFVKPTGLNLNYNGSWHRVEMVEDPSGNYFSTRILFNEPAHRTVPLYADAPGIIIDNLALESGALRSPQFRRLFGYRVREILITGTGNNRQPTGTLTVTPPAGFTINGGAAGVAATFTGFTGPVVCRLEIDPATATNIIVTFPSGREALMGSAVYDPASLADGAGATTTVTVTGAALGDFAAASFSLDLQGIMLTAWVSATNTVSVRFQNETGGTIDLASGTLRARAMKV